MPKLHGPHVVALVYDGLCTFEFGVVAEVFGLARPEMGPSWYRFSSFAMQSGPLRAHGGFSFTPDNGSEMLDSADLIVIPGWKGVDAEVPEDLIQALRKAHGRGARLASICSGAFVLAATGLLDGATATTHWRYAEAFRRRFPDVMIDEKALYRSANSIFTSAGSAAGIDLMIEIVRQDFGADTANSVARRIVMPAHRSGGQAQFLERPVRPVRSNGVAPLLDRIRIELHLPWTIGTMADAVNMSRRSFERRFSEATGQTPIDWLQGERVEAAKDHLLRSTSSIEEIANLVGFTNAHALRHHFRIRVDQSPAEYRREFRLKR